MQHSTHRPDHRFSHDDIDPPGKIHGFPDLYDIVHDFSGRELSNMPDLGQVSWIGSVLYMQILDTIS